MIELRRYFSEEGLLPIISACPNLSKLNLTGCRGVRIADRRRFFEVKFLKQLLCVYVSLKLVAGIQGLGRTSHRKPLHSITNGIAKSGNYYAQLLVHMPLLGPSRPHPKQAEPRRRLHKVQRRLNIGFAKNCTSQFFSAKF